MIQILIVEDDNEKARQIEQAIRECDAGDSFEIEVVSERSSACSVMRNRQIDLLILDLLIPLKAGSEPDPKGGEKLLQEISELVGMKLPWQIIGLTAHENLLGASSPVFLKETWVILQFDERSTEWIEQLHKRLNYLLKAERTSQKSPRRPSEIDLAIITALPSEMSAVQRVFSETWDDEIIPNDKTTKYYTSIIETSKGRKINVLTAHAPEMGLSASAALITKTIMNFCPKGVVMAGIAAGVRDRVGIGDILIGDPVWDYSAGKLMDVDGNVEFHPATAQRRLSGGILSQLSPLCGDVVTKKLVEQWTGRRPNDFPKLHIGPMASGGMVLAYAKRLKEIERINRKLLGIDMEAFALHLSAYLSPSPQPWVFSAKSVCDFGDNEKSDDFQEYAAYMSASFIKYVATHVISWA